MKNQNPVSSNRYPVIKFSARGLIAASGLFAGTTLAAPPDNDNFAQAINLSLVGSSGIQTGTNTVDATFEVDEPRLEPTNVIPINNTVWFKWTAPDNGTFTFDTLGSTDLSDAEWDAVIGIYSGPSLAELTPLGDTPQDLSTPEKMTIPVTTGTTYFIQLAGLDSITAANVKLTWSFDLGVPEAKITSFGPGGVVGDISNNAATINWIAPFGSDLSTISPTFTLSPGATCNRLSGVIPGPNFNTGPIVYTVTAQPPSSLVTEYTVTATVGNSLTWNVASGGQWDTNTTNWLNQTSGVSASFADRDDVTFNNNSGGTITIASAVSPQATIVNAASGNYTFTGAALAGIGSLTKSNAGDLTLTGTNTYSGSTAVNGGTLTVKGTDAIRGSNNFVIASGAILNFDTLPGNPLVDPLWVATSATLTGAGTLNLDLGNRSNVGLNLNMSAFTGTANIFGGALAIVDIYSPRFVSPQTGTINIGENTTLYLGWRGNSFTSNIKLSAESDNREGLGVLRGDFATLNGTVTLAKNSSIGCDNDPTGVELFTINSTISDGGGGFGFTTVGRGTVILTALANTYTGTTTVKFGSTLQPNTPGALGRGPLRIDGQLNPNYLGSKTVASLELGGIAQTASGTYGSTASLATYTNDIYFKPGSTGTVQIGSKFESWMSGYTFQAGAVVTESGDADGDGVTNFQEYAFGLDPSLSSSVNPITQPLNKVTGNFQYTRLATTGLVYTALTSTDLINWTAGGNSQTGLTSLGNLETVTVNVSAPAVAGKLFVKVQAAPVP